MKTPSAYPVLDNRPIDQWKVTELKEELKRRKLGIKGLKDDLVRRLDEALRNELESVEEVNVKNDVEVSPEPIVQTEDVGLLDGTPQPEANADGEGESALDQKIESMMTHGNSPDSEETSGCKSGINEESVVIVTSVETNVLVNELPNEGQIQDVEGTVTDLVETEEKITEVTSVETSVTVTESVMHEVSMDVKESLKDDFMSVGGDLKTQFEVQKSEPPQDLEVKSSEETSGCKSGINEESVVIVTSVETNVLVNEELPNEGQIQDVEGTVTDLVETEEKITEVTSVETSVTVTESVMHEVSMDVKESLKDDFMSVGGDLKTQFEVQKSESPQDLEVKSSDVGDQVSEVSTDVAFQVTQLEADVAKPPQDDVKLNSANPSNQVSEVNAVLGFQVKSDSISSDSVSINEKNELKDNIIDANVKLELDVKPEMVHPSSSNIISDEPHPMDVEEPGDKKEPVEEFDERNANLDMSKKNDSIDVGLPEKLNLDRSSGDDSMDDDIMGNKPIDSKYNSSGVVDQDVKIEGSDKEEVPIVMPNDIPADKKDVVDEMEKAPAAPIVKRKHNDQVVAGNNEISKRQRRWNTGNIKVPEPQSNTLSSTTPTETFRIPTLNRSFSRSDSTASKETPKERVVPPSPKPPTTSLRIDQFLRPFTLKAVQELLGKTGSVVSFWMDNIKTHCFVTYSSVEEALETRNAVYNLQWPPNGGRLLSAEFVDPQEVKVKVEGPPPSPATPATTRPSILPQPLPTAQPPRQQALAPPPSLPPPPTLSNPPQARERLPPPPPIEKMEKIDAPILTLDDLFRKTKATPRIYYLPLSDEQVAEKRRKMKQ